MMIWRHPVTINLLHQSNIHYPRFAKVFFWDIPISRFPADTTIYLLPESSPEDIFHLHSPPEMEIADIIFSKCGNQQGIGEPFLSIQQMYSYRLAFSQIATLSPYGHSLRVVAIMILPSISAYTSSSFFFVASPKIPSTAKP